MNHRVIAVLAATLAGLGSVLAAEQKPDQQTSTTVGDVSEFDPRTRGANPESWPGAKVYRETCAACHEGQVAKAPAKMFLQMLSAPTIYDSLTTGIMAPQAAPLTDGERRHVAEYLAVESLAEAAKRVPVKRCDGPRAEPDLDQRPVPVGWGFHNARAIPAEVARLPKADVARLALKWAFEFPGGIRARSQPSIAYGAVYVGSYDGTVYALDLETGCARWTQRASGEVRTGVVVHAEPKAGADVPRRLYFGDVIAHVYALDALSGAVLWKVKVDDHPNATVTGTPALHEGVLYVPVSSLEVTTAADPKYECCRFRGSVVALDAATGAVRWKSYTIDEEPRAVARTRIGTNILAPSGAPVWNSPMVDARRGVLYVGTGENYSSPANDRSDAVLAMRLTDGAVVWSHQTVKGDAWNVACMMKDNPNCPAENGPDLDIGAGLVLHRLSSGRDVLLAGLKTAEVLALDPDRKGAPLWKTPLGRGAIQGGIHFGMAVAEGRIYAPIADMKDSRDGRTYVGAPRPGINAVDAATGKVHWSTPADDVCGGREYCDPGISAAVTAIPGAVFAGHMDGRFRAYDGENGKVLFEFDATRDIRTVSGAVARGGSFGGAGAAVRDGHVVVNSGYGLYFHMPGNVLLVFSAGGR
jgi:polyvinyl alcohol dehydrogenase (cytochrome)